MTRSSTKELFTPLENPKRVFRLKRRLFETPGLIESNSPKFDLFSDIEERLEEKGTEEMTKTMEQYMSKTRRDYGSGVTRPKINTNTHFELKGNFSKNFATILSVEVILFYNELDVPTRQILDSKGAILTKTTANAKVAIQEMAEYSQKWHNVTSRTRSTETSDGLAAIQAQLNSLEREIKKVNEKVYAAQFGAPYQPRGQYRAVGPGFYQRNYKNSSYPDQRQTIEESLTKFMAEPTKRHEENSNIIKEIRASTDIAIRNQRASIKTLEIQIG
ncbi:hypothetical protein Tco_1064677 [Tanacetum coccineum]